MRPPCDGRLALGIPGGFLLHMPPGTRTGLAGGSCVSRPSCVLSISNAIRDSLNLVRAYPWNLVRAYLWVRLSAGRLGGAARHRRYELTERPNNKRDCQLRGPCALAGPNTLFASPLNLSTDSLAFSGRSYTVLLCGVENPGAGHEWGNQIAHASKCDFPSRPSSRKSGFPC